MREVEALEAKGAFASLLELVENGEDVLITRDGRPVARLIRDAGPRDRAAARRAAAEIIEMRKGVTLGGDVTIRELIDEGRR